MAMAAAHKWCSLFFERKIMQHFPIKKVMMYCFFSYLITSFCFLMLFLDATYNSTGTFPSSIALISSSSLPVMDAMFSGDIPL